MGAQEADSHAALLLQYVGAVAMTIMLSRRSMLKLSDLRSLPSLDETLQMLQPGLPLAFCVAAMMTTVVTATNLASGYPLCSVPKAPCCTRMRATPAMGFKIAMPKQQVMKPWFRDGVPSLQCAGGGLVYGCWGAGVGG